MNPERRPRELEDAYVELLREAQAQISKLSHEARRLSDQVVELTRSSIAGEARRLASVWLTGRPGRRRVLEAWDDPIYGHGVIDKKLVPLLAHPLVQRLNYVRQLSFAYLTFPSASHTRLSHTLGVVRNTQKALRRALAKGVVYRSAADEVKLKGKKCMRVVRLPDPLPVPDRVRDEILLKAQLCALVHDLGHGPFGHALDKLIPYYGGVERTDPPDTVYALKYIEQFIPNEIRRAGIEPERVVDVLDKDRRLQLKGYDVLLADLIASMVDVDRMDYLVRDAHMTGLEMGHVSVEALLHHMCVLQRGDDFTLVYDEAALPHIENLAYAHHMMYINCYEHPRKVAAERILIRLAEWLLENGLAKQDLMLLTDDDLLALLNRFVPVGGREAYWLSCLKGNSPFCEARQYRVANWDETRKRMVPAEGLADEVVAWFTLRLGPKPNLTDVFLTYPARWESRICELAELTEEDRWKVLVTVPAFDAKMQQESGAQVVTHVDSTLCVQEFYDASPLMSSISTGLAPVRQTIRVLVDCEQDQEVVERIRREADQAFTRQ
jgi:HD superfamily phosphohydrolase